MCTEALKINSETCWKRIKSNFQVWQYFPHTYTRIHAKFSTRKVIHTGKEVCPQVCTVILLGGGRTERPAKAAFSTHLCQETLKKSSAHLTNANTQMWWESNTTFFEVSLLVITDVLLRAHVKGKDCFSYTEMCFYSSWGLCAGFSLCCTILTLMIIPRLLLFLPDSPITFWCLLCTPEIHVRLSHLYLIQDACLTLGTPDEP